MWCQRCQQDVPGVALSSGSGFGCARCGTQVGNGSKLAGHTIGVAEAATTGLNLEEPKIEPEAPEIEIDDWDLEDDWLNLIDMPEPRSRGSALPPWTSAPEYTAPAAAPWMPPHAAHPQLNQYRPMPGHAASCSGSAAAPASRAGGGFAWFVVSLGLTGLVLRCGFATRVDAHRSRRALDDGLPIAVGGQVVLLLGLALQLERIGQGSRKAADKLEHVDEQLHNLHQATTMLGIRTALHRKRSIRIWPKGANPQMLLADVKSQLDMLAMRMAQQKR